ncbi:MAG: hypothetical protein IKL11_02175 [Muribaculaceae bacterium]|nr:hypothetical protein [Muribaculaceae bacterium]
MAPNHREPLLRFMGVVENTNAVRSTRKRSDYNNRGLSEAIPPERE